LNKLTHTPTSSTQALSIANHERRWFSHLADRTKGIVFFSTPHRGVNSDVAGVLGNMAKILAMGSRERHRNRDLDYLRPDSVHLMSVADDFRPIASKYALVSFIETEKTRLAPGLHRKVSIVIPFGLLTLSNPPNMLAKVQGS
jgi:hypothetical protein